MRGFLVLVRLRAVLLPIEPVRLRALEQPSSTTAEKVRIPQLDQEIFVPCMH